MINLAVIGYGYWGPNIVRNVMERPELELWGVCEMNPDRVSKFNARYPRVRTCANYQDVLDDPSVDAVAIATPPATHYPLAEQALRAGKHVLVEGCGSNEVTSECRDSLMIRESERRQGPIFGR